MSGTDRKPPPESNDDPVPSSALDDSFLRGAAELSEPSPSAIEAAAERTSQLPRVELAQGRVIAKRYRLDKELGRGGMGVVWAATHLVTRRGVAIKFLGGSASLRVDLHRRFLREARAASAVRHPNVVEVSDVFELDDETPVMVMELLSGETLRERLTRSERLPIGEAASIMLPVASAAAAAHALGIVHRDLKPENIFLARGADEGEVVKVLDFGVAKLMALELEGTGSDTDLVTGTGSMLGTPAYMAPEQTLGEKDIDQRADIWALGVILYECLAGVRPVQGSGIGQVVMKLATEGIVPLEQVVPDLPKEATTLVMRMLARERAERPQDLRQVREVLARLAGQEQPPLTPTVVSGRTPSDGGARRSEPHAQIVDTASPQTVPQRTNRGPRRSFFLGAAAGSVVVIAFAVWKVSAPSHVPAVAPQADEQATAIVAPAPAVTIAPSASIAALPLAAPASSHDALTERDASASLHAAVPAQRAPKAASAAPDKSSAPPPPVTPAATPEPAPANPMPIPGGLAKKPPF